MLEKPDLPDERIVACLSGSYGLKVGTLEFLPLGYDANAGVYRVTADDGTPYFLKARQSDVTEPSLAVPRALKDIGIEQIVAPIPTREGRLMAEISPFALILHPFVDGHMVKDAGLPDKQWVELGSVVRRMHGIRLPDNAHAEMPRETFRAKSTDLVRQVDAAIGDQTFDAPFQREAAETWRANRAAIHVIADRTEALGRSLRVRSPPFVVCHADLHTANLLTDANSNFWIVDWDGAILAPKERDLMFATGAGAGLSVAYSKRAQALFFRGYGSDEMDAQAIAYYRCDWVMQDAGEFAHQVLFGDMGDEAKADLLRNVRSIFQPGNTAEVALNSP